MTHSENYLVLQIWSIHVWDENGWKKVIYDWSDGWPSSKSIWRHRAWCDTGVFAGSLLHDRSITGGKPAWAISLFLTRSHRLMFSIRLQHLIRKPSRNLTLHQARSVSQGSKANYQNVLLAPWKDCVQFRCNDVVRPTPVIMWHSVEHAHQSNAAKCCCSITLSANHHLPQQPLYIT